MTEHLLESINEDYDMFYSFVRRLMVTMEGFRERFGDYQGELYDIEDYGSENEVLIGSALHLIDEFLYDAERLKRRG